MEGLDKNGVGVTTEGELDLWLHHRKSNSSQLHTNANANIHTDVHHQSTVKRLHNRTSNIYQVDLLTSDQVKDASSKVNHEQNVGSVKISLLEWHVKRYRELHIISQKIDSALNFEVEIKPEGASKAEETVA